MNRDELHALVDDVLVRCIHLITGDRRTPSRPGQVALAHDILDAMLGDSAGPGHVAGCAPTGVGKGLAAGAPAFLMAALRGDRSVVSTSSKALQDQLRTKDYPVIAQAVEEATGVPVTFASHKGFSNYGCPAKAFQNGSDLLKGLGKELGAELISPDRKERLSAEAAKMNATAATDLGIALRRAASGPASALVGEGRLGRRSVPLVESAELASWVLIQAAAEDSAERSEYPGDSRDALWGLVSVGPEECAGTSCPLVASCPAYRAREKAQHAQVVIVNHTLLALQASLAVPVVLSNNHLGMFSHLVVDEAHDLPPTVRSTGASSINELRLRALAAQLDSLVGSSQGVTNAKGDALVAQGRALAEHLTYRLSPVVAQGGEPVSFTVADHPLAPMREPITDWVAQVRQAVPLPSQVDASRTQMDIRRMRHALTRLLDDLALSLDPEAVLARWVEIEDRGPSSAPVVSCKFSPVDVAPAISRELFSTNAPETPEETAARKAAEKSGEPYERVRLPLSVTMISATILDGFERDAGLRCTPKQYASPFDDAYARSMLYVPRVSDPAELDRIGRRNGRRWNLDVTQHCVWAGEQMLAMVRANGGSALILSSTARAGRHYADLLRTRGVGHTVLSQWDGADPRQVIQKWREDSTSVLVGTRSMMTGVDAAGDTCTLVIVDRVPRNPANVVDEARASRLIESGMDRWAADRRVYGADAALLLEQAAGRLIRSLSDYGCCAILDPRLMKGTPISYAESTRAAYMTSLRRFPNRTGTFESVLEYLRTSAHRAA